MKRIKKSQSLAIYASFRDLFSSVKSCRRTPTVGNPEPKHDITCNQLKGSPGDDVKLKSIDFPLQSPYEGFVFFLVGQLGYL